jgi:hypothetical protein
MRTYDPANQAHRQHLATAIRAECKDAKFLVTDPDGYTKEEVHEFQTPADRIRVLVYTTIVNDEVRQTGRDAVRVCAVYRNEEGKEFGIVKVTRVNRTGDVAGICERMRGRMRHVYLEVNNTQKCPDCGAPMFMTKKKPNKPSKPCCAELCWKKPRKPTPTPAANAAPAEVEDGTVDDEKPW